MKTLTVSAALLASAALFASVASAAPIVVEHQGGTLGAVDVYANGTLLYRGLSPNSNTLGARTLTVDDDGSTLNVVVTPTGVKPGVADVLTKTFSFTGSSDAAQFLTLGADRKGAPTLELNTSVPQQ